MVMDESGFQLVAVAVDKDKSSQNALKWAVENIVQRGQTITLIHVKTKNSSSLPTSQEEIALGYRTPTDQQTKEMFLPFRCYCTRKDVQCRDVVLEDSDITKAIVEFASHAAIEKLVVGAASKGGFVRLKSSDKPTNICKAAPDFCTVYVISKGKVSSVRNAIRAAPANSPLRAQLQGHPKAKHEPTDMIHAKHEAAELHSLRDESIRSPFIRGNTKPSAKSFAELSSLTENDTSFMSTGRPSVDRTFTPRQSTGSDGSGLDMMRTPHKWMDSFSSGSEFSSTTQDMSGASWTSQNMVCVSSLVTQRSRRYVCPLQSTAKQKVWCQFMARHFDVQALDFHRWKMEEEQKLEEARHAEENAMALVKQERLKCKAAMEAAEASQRIAELEAQKRINAEMTALKEAEDLKKTFDTPGHSTIRYRRYTIEEIESATDNFAESRKIGEGGYGPVFKCYLDHTQVAIKVLRPDAAQGRTQFQQEVEILSCIRHPNMVLLLGACPEYGCLVYEYMANGSLEDCLFRHGNTPPIPWQHRFRIAAEIGTGLLFLHQTKPEPLVHRDLKPANILLDRNYVSKIGDVGLARLVPPSVANNVTQYLMTSTAGTFCYIDPEYQQTGMLGIKSDIYSLGIMLLQIVTAKPPMGLTHHVERAIEKGTFKDLLDPAIPDWPVEEALSLASMALKCAELRRKDRPDLCTVVLPELERLREFADEQLNYNIMGSNMHSSPIHSYMSQQSRYESSRSRPSVPSMAGRRSSVA